MRGAGECGACEFWWVQASQRQSDTPALHQALNLVSASGAIEGVTEDGS